MRDSLSLIRRTSKDEQERLLTSGVDGEEMVTVDESSLAALKDSTSPEISAEHQDLDGAAQDHEEENPPRAYRVYKRRWFGLMQLVLMNIIVSWDVSSPSTSPNRSITPPTNPSSGSPTPPSPIQQLPTSPPPPPS